MSTRSQPQPTHSFLGSTNNPEERKDDGHADTGESNSSKLVIVEPADIVDGRLNLSEESVQDLFVEMCFFARLGFVQPPRCLQCTYRESQCGEQPNMGCPRWVIWRKNANVALHPHKFDNNILIVRCHSVRRLLAGETVGKFTWDKSRQEVIWHQWR